MGTAPSEDHSSNNRGQGNNPDHRNLFYGNKGSMLHIPFHKLSLKHLSSILGRLSKKKNCEILDICQIIGR